MLQDGQAETAGEAEVEGDVERVAAAREVLLQLAGDRVEAGWGVEDPGADLRGQRGQYRVVVLAVEGHLDQAALGGREQEGADRGVERAVGDVQEALPGC